MNPVFIRDFRNEDCRGAPSDKAAQTLLQSMRDAFRIVKAAAESRAAPKKVAAVFRFTNVPVKLSR